MSAHIGRIEKVEGELKALASSTSTKEEASKLRAELKKAHDTLHLEALDLKAHVWGIRAHLFVKNEYWLTVSFCRTRCPRFEQDCKVLEHALPSIDYKRSLSSHHTSQYMF